MLTLNAVNRNKTIEELAKEAGMTPDKVTGLHHRYRETVLSLERSIGEGVEQQIGDLIADTEAVNPSEAAEHQLLKEAIQRELTKLSERAKSLDTPIWS